MVVTESSKAGRAVRPKLKCLDTNDTKHVTKTERKHRLKQRFEVIKKLGQGTYGKVQLAINKETGQEVAIKTIKKSKVESEQDLIRIRREIQIMSSIQHPHIIHIYEVFENKDKIVLVMQYASGGEVYDYVSHRKVLSDSEARRLFRQIATAIYYCHKNKICHRDLKLENILLDEKGNAKIADFGLSNVFDEKHFLQTFCGSPLYASPEIVKGQPYFGPEVDCWSLGVLLYTLVYGAMPFDGSNFKRLVKSITESNYYEPNQKSEASQLIKRLLAPNPKQRATIIDICTDWWVNSGFEHSLLQVSEDMANLTPVRLEILLALAPTSPSEKTAPNPFDNSEAKVEEPSDKPNDNVENLQESGVIAEANDSLAKKRVANPSFDQSSAAVPTKGQKKKKTKTESQVIADKEKSVKNRVEGSDKCEDNSAVEKSQVCETSRDERPAPTLTQDIENKENNKEVNPNKSELITETIETNDSGVSMTPQNVLNEEPAEPMECSEKEPKDRVEDSPKNSEDVTKSENKLVVETKETIEQKVAEQSNSKAEVKTEVSADRAVTVSEATSCEAKASEGTGDLLTVQGTGDTPEPTQAKDDGKGSSPKPEQKKRLERRGSVKRPGRLSIPNIWNKTVEESGSTSGLSDKSSDAKSERKAPFIPVGFRVSDAKRAFERRCSVPANNLLHSSSTLNKLKESDNSGEDHKRVGVRQVPPKLSSRSMSLNVMLDSPRKVQELNEILKKKEKVEEMPEQKEPEETKTSDQIGTTSSSPASSIIEEATKERVPSPVANKDMAKDILKKSIAKAQMKQKKHNSNESINRSANSSPTTTPVLSIENSDVSILSEPTSFKKPRPFVKEESEAINKVEAKSNEIQDKPNNVVAQRETSGPITTGDADEGDKAVDATDTKPQPIARSYKKVTFTKDGACVTETGKIYSSEGSDGSYTRVERKSKVTHFPTTPSETPSKTSANSEEGVQRSDSLSSSGSLDIFDDIFDNHWCGDEVLFPNVKSLLKGFGSKGKSSSRRRSRAESCERNSSDWFGRKNGSIMSDQEAEDDEFDSFPTGLRQSSRPLASLFDKSIFSRHFSEFDREFEDPFNSVQRSVSRDRSSFSSRIHPTSFKIVFGPQTSVRTTSSKTGFDGEDYVVDSPSVTNDSRTRFTDRSRESDSFFPRKADSFDSSRKRVEQWLESDGNNEFNEDLDMKTGPLSMYATVGPRGVRRYLRTMTGRPNERSTDSMGSSSSIGLFRSTSQQTSANNSKTSVPRDSVLDLKFSLNPTASAAGGDPTAATDSTHTNTQTAEALDGSDDFQSSIVLPESSSLLDQLRTHGYRNIVSQRLSGSSLFADLDSNLPETTDKTYKRGNPVLSHSSAATENATARQCMPSSSSNPSATTAATAETTAATAAVTSSATTSESASVASPPPMNGNRTVSDRNGNNDSDWKASDHLNHLTETLNNCLNQQSSEHIQTSTRSTARNPQLRNHSKTTTTLPHKLLDDLDLGNPTTNKTVNFKESVQERIHRKSFYSRFNDDRPVLSSVRQRRRSFIDTEDIDIALGLKSPSLLTRGSHSFRNSISVDENSDHIGSRSHSPFVSKPPSHSSHSSDWFSRMESRASQLMDDLLANDRTFGSFGEPFHSRSSRKSSETNFSSNGWRRRSASATRSPLSTPRSLKSDLLFDSLSTADDNNDETEEKSESNKEDSRLKSPEEVLRRAIDILSQSEQNSHF